MSKIFAKNGYLNWDYIAEQPETFISVVGARGVGKSYGAFDKLIKEKKRFIYLRRLKSQLEQCSKLEGNPFKKINIDRGYNIIPYSSSNIITFRHDDKDGEIVALGVALSVVANIRGFDLSEYDYIVFDEFIPQVGEYPIKNEFDAFLNFYETVNRNRELEGKKPVKCFMLGNANTLVNPYFVGWHMMKTVCNMLTGCQMVWRSEDKTRLTIMVIDSPISRKKQKTALYRNASKDFITMAIDNAFRTDETKIKSEPLKEYKHLVSCGEIGIYIHKSERRYYISSVTGSPMYDAYGISLKMFQQDFYILKSYYLVTKNVWFESFEVEIIFREIFNLK